MTVQELSERQATFIKRIKADRDWYRLRRRQLLVLWLVLSITSQLLGFITSIFIAIGWPDPTNAIGKAFLVALPAIAAFCGTILVHFRLRETWELRELGRIDLEELMIGASYLPLDDPEKFNLGLRELEMTRIRISREQTTRFFSTLVEKSTQGSDTAASKPG